MSIHSKFLVHWTGRDFHSRNSALTRDIREQYVGRLLDDCLRGLFMKPGSEVIYGVGKTQITAKISRICFSEVRLSQAESHAKRYGMLGIGVHSDFVVKRQGNPVFYVQNGDEGLVIENLDHIAKYLKANLKEKDKFLLSEFAVALGFLKGMSEPNNSKFEYYEEMEWRIVHTKRLERQYCIAQDKSKYIYRLTISPKDVKILVFPDYETKQMATEDDRIKDFFKNGFPMMTTVEDCKSF